MELFFIILWIIYVMVYNKVDKYNANKEYRKYHKEQEKRLGIRRY